MKIRFESWLGEMPTTFEGSSIAVLRMDMELAGGGGGCQPGAVTRSLSVHVWRENTKACVWCSPREESRGMKDIPAALSSVRDRIGRTDEKILPVWQRRDSLR